MINIDGKFKVKSVGGSAYLLLPKEAVDNLEFDVEFLGTISIETKRIRSIVIVTDSA